MILKMTLCPYQDLAIHAKVIHKEEIDRVLHLHVPCGYSFQNTPIGVFEVTNRDSDSSHSVEFTVVENRPWVDIDFSKLNIDPGYHVYLVKFQENTTGDITGMYFAYTLQTDSPDRPYYYMQGARECET